MKKSYKESKIIYNQVLENAKSARDFHFAARFARDLLRNEDDVKFALREGLKFELQRDLKPESVEAARSKYEIFQYSRELIKIEPTKRYDNSILSVGRGAQKLFFQNGMYLEAAVVAYECGDEDTVIDNLMKVALDSTEKEGLFIRALTKLRILKPGSIDEEVRKIISQKCETEFNLLSQRTIRDKIMGRADWTYLSEQ